MVEKVRFARRRKCWRNSGCQEFPYSALPRAAHAGRGTRSGSWPRLPGVFDRGLSRRPPTWCSRYVMSHIDLRLRGTVAGAKKPQQNPRWREFRESGPAGDGRCSIILVVYRVSTRPVWRNCPAFQASAGSLLKRYSGHYISVVHRNYWYIQRQPVAAMQGGTRWEWLVLSKRPNAAVRPQDASLRARRKAAIRCVMPSLGRQTTASGI